MAKNVTEITSLSEVKALGLATIMEHVSVYNTLASKLAETRGKMGAAVKEAETEDGLNRAALKFVAKMDTAPDEKFLDWWRTAGPYIEARVHKLDNVIPMITDQEAEPDLVAPDAPVPA